MPQISAKVIADSVSPAGKRITTLEVKFHRFILPEFNTHRAFSRNFSSSRAIPTARMLDQVRNDPAMPIHWGQNQAGMQANHEIQHVEHARDLWRISARKAADMAESMAEIGLHKQVVNRTLEPYLFVHGIVTSTEWDNFFDLRCHPDAQPEIQELAVQMRYARAGSLPKVLEPGHWHLPYITSEDCDKVFLMTGGEGSDAYFDLLRKISAARACRVSYLKHDGHPSTIEEDLALCDRLAGAVPIHASPFEHAGTPDVITGTRVIGYLDNNPNRPQLAPAWERPELHGNFVGWVQSRKLIEQMHAA